MGKISDVLNESQLVNLNIFKQKFAYKYADKVVSVLPYAEKYMIEHGLREGKFAYIPNGISLEEVSNLEMLNDKTRDAIPKDKFIVGFTGKFGLSNSLNTLLEAAAIVQTNYKDICFVLIGSGSEKENLIRLKESLALQNCLLLDAIPKNQVQAAIALFNISVITWDNKPSLYRFGISPNKVFDYMYAGKPIIQAVEAGNDLIQDASCGLTVTPCNPLELADAIIKIYNMPEKERNILGENGRRFVVENHTYTKLALDFIKELQ